MSRRLVCGIVAALVAAAVTAAAAASVSVRVDRVRIETQLGHKFAFSSTIVNRGSAPAGRLIAHLNVLSLRSAVYVDPEDWSTHRTRFLGTIPAGGSTSLTWPMQAVNAGTFGVYVTVVSATGAPRPPVAGPAIRVSVADRKTLNSGGILPLTLGIPGLVGLLIIGVRVRRRG
jgi:hypothetical protein